VLTEDDFFDYLIATSRLDLLLPTLVGRLMQSALLFLGFRLDDWRFRVLFRMIIIRQGTETMKELSHVGVQVNPDEQSFADVERARKYMEGYFQGGRSAPQISIYWGSSSDFLRQLRQHLSESKPDEPPPPPEKDSDDWG
jgi:SIR2-like domain